MVDEGTGAHGTRWARIADMALTRARVDAKVIASTAPKVSGFEVMFELLFAVEVRSGLTFKAHVVLE